jgi:hypothetical protein
MNTNIVSIHKYECLNDEIINLSYYTQNTHILKPIPCKKNVMGINIKKNSYNDFKKIFNNSSNYFIKSTE